MRSKDMAKLAGVSVRTLRHYHELGLMPEPSRSQNGYRDYTPIDLVRLFRIKRLASLGFSLSQIASMLESMDADEHGSRPGSTVLSALDSLDCELAAKIESLQEQRQVIAMLRTDELNPDMPLRFARIWQMLESAQNLDGLNAESRIALLLVGHLYNDRELDELERVVQGLLDDNMASSINAVNRLFDELKPEASDEQIERVVRDSLMLLEPLIAVFDADNWKGDDEDRVAVLKSAAGDALNRAQVKAAARIEGEIGIRLENSAQKTSGH